MAAALQIPHFLHLLRTLQVRFRLSLHLQRGLLALAHSGRSVGCCRVGGNHATGRNTIAETRASHRGADRDVGDYAIGHGGDGRAADHRDVGDTA